MDGLLAIGGDLRPNRLLTAYRQGIFPWGTLDGLPLWHSPDPRMVLFPAEIRISRTLGKTLRKGQYEIRLDQSFAAVILSCAETPRPGQGSTWITSDMQAAYVQLHALGWAHSVETWMDGELAGGLYGLTIGHVFFGESMFSRRTDASKIALAHLCRFLHKQGFGLIDCQMHTSHLASLGARAIPMAEFQQHLRRLVASQDNPGHWPTDSARHDWSKDVL